MTGTRRRGRLGVTLVELLIAIAILSIVGTAITSVYLSSNRMFQTGVSIAEAQAQARRAMSQIEREVRAGSRSSLDVVPDENSVVYDILAFSTILPNDTTLTELRYEVDAAGNLVREENGVARIVASSISAMQVVVKSNSVAVDLHVRVHNARAVLSTEVEFRNP